MIGFADGHCDTISRLAQNGEALLKNSGHWDLERLKKFEPSLQIFAAWLQPKCYENALHETVRQIEYYHQEMEKNSHVICEITKSGQIEGCFKQKKHCGMLAIEGGESLMGDIANLHKYYDMGVRAMTLTWNGKNELADGVKATQPCGGLTPFGKDVVREMEEIGMLVDVSHIAEEGFWDVFHQARKPFFASHSNAKAVCDVGRNLSDDQLKAIASVGGTAGLNFYPPFLTKNKTATLDDLVRHGEHMLRIMGEDGVALGSDFDGIDEVPTGLEHIGQLECLMERFQFEFGERLTRKMAQENLLRVLYHTI